MKEFFRSRRSSWTFSVGVLIALAFLLGLPISGQSRAAPRVVQGRAQNMAQQAAQQAAANAPRAIVYMLDADHFDGPVLALKDGELSIDADPPRTVAFDEVDRIEMGSGGGVMVVWVGQDNHDGTGTGSNQAASGIQDIHLECRGIPIGRQLQQVVISGVLGGEAHVWMLNLNDAPFWKLENVRPDNSTTANWYIEPPATDCFDQSFDVSVTFADNTSFKTRLKATTHTDVKLKADKEKGQQAAAKPADDGPLVFLAGDETVRGRSIEIAGETLVVQATSGGELKIPLAEVRGVWLGGNAPPQCKRFDERLKKPGQSDWVMIRAKEKEAEKEADKDAKDKDAKKDEAPANAQSAQEGDEAATKKANNPAASDPEAEKAAERQVAAVEGSVQGIAEGKLSLIVGDDTRKVAMPRVVAMVMAVHAATPQPETFRQIFELANGEKMSGQLLAIKPESLDIHTRYGGDVQLPRGEVKSITCRGGQATWLSDLEPASVEEVAYFDRPLNYHRDQNLSGAPLTVRGTAYRKGLAVHSRCILTYALDGRYELFRTRLGFEDGVPLGGSVACRVLADDRELYGNTAFRVDAEPVSLKLDLTGAKQLVLEVDFGEMQNIGDRVVWGAARVVRPASERAKSAAPSPSASTTPAAAPTLITTALPATAGSESASSDAGAEAAETSLADDTSSDEDDEEVDELNLLN